MKTDKDVHTEHCCLKHGCCYRSIECTVVTGEKPQSGPCETCTEDKIQEREYAREICMDFHGSRKLDRIPIVLAALRKLWEKYPDQRLAQLIVNTLDARPNPIFPIEDEVLLLRLTTLEKEGMK